MGKPKRNEALRAWSKMFLALATKLDQPAIGAQWFMMGVPAEDAAAWANLGYMPGEAKPLIDQGITPAMARDMEQIATDVAGGPDERAMQVIDGLVADGILVDPRRVRRMQDPDDPDHTIVRILPEPDEQ